MMAKASSILPGARNIERPNLGDMRRGSGSFMQKRYRTSFWSRLPSGVKGRCVRTGCIPYTCDSHQTRRPVVTHTRVSGPTLQSGPGPGPSVTLVDRERLFLSWQPSERSGQ